MSLFTRKPSSVLLALALGAMTPALVQAQETTSEIRGQVLDKDGNPIAGAQVEILDSRTGARRSLSTNAAGSYVAHDLPVGGPFIVSAKSADGEQKQADIYLSLGDSYTANLVIGGAQQIETLVVVGHAEPFSGRAIGPNASYNLHALETAPAMNRDLKDVVRIDPRVYIDEAFADSVQCAGSSPRFNSLTVDGVRLNDNFGLNSNGYPTERMPFSYDAIEQVSVELAPFDVQYGGFTACNINAVTKSGGNEFHGSAFFDYTNNDYNGDSFEDGPVLRGDLTERRYGATISGPILHDKLFFMVSAEKAESQDSYDVGPAGSGRSNEVAGVSQAQLDQITSIASSVYGYTPGTLPPSIPVEDNKLLVKLDWYLSDKHRAAFTYNHNDGYHITAADSGGTRLSTSDHWYERGADLNAYVGQLFSSWTDAFSTEVKLGYSRLNNHQIPQGDLDFGQIQIGTQNDADGDGTPSRATVYLGPDQYRQANKLFYETYTVKLAANYLTGNHALTGGYEAQLLDVFNLFVPSSQGVFEFGSIDAFAAGTPSRVSYINAVGSNNANDGAAQFGYGTHTLYAQDKYHFDALPLTLTAGLRYDFYTSSDLPKENPNFEAAYGFSNAQNLDGLSLLQPRLAFNWEPQNKVKVYGGVGLFSGGNPNVWVSNNYSNNGVTTLFVRQDYDGNTVPAYAGDGRALYNVPQELYDQVTDGSVSGSVNVLDPSFKVPSEWKYALGTAVGDLSDWLLQLDYLHTEKQDAAIVYDISREQIGQAIDGRPIYGSANGRKQDFMLTNVNGDSGSTDVLSAVISKSFDFGLDTSFGYAFTQAEDVNPMTSSIASSNYRNLAVFDIADPGVATSNYEIPHRFTLKLAYEHAFFGDFNSRATVFASRNQGQPFSYTFTNYDANGDGKTDTYFSRAVGDTYDDSRHLLYMPTGINDPNVIFDPGFDTEAFFAYANEHGLTQYAGGTVPRNAFNSNWWTKVDLKLEQQLPGFRSADKSSVYLLVDNLLNLLNDEWGVHYEAPFPRTQPIVGGSIDQATGKYVFGRYFEPPGQSRVTGSSLWQIRVGLRYEF